MDSTSTRSRSVSDLPYLQAVIEQWEFEDCWCGYGFDEVIATYIVSGAHPSVHARAFARDAKDPGSFPALESTYERDPGIRQAGLVADVESVLKRQSDDVGREAELRRLPGGAELLDNSEFWSTNGEPCASKRASTFLAYTLAHAKAVKFSETPPGFRTWEESRRSRDADVLARGEELRNLRPPA